MRDLLFVFRSGLCVFLCALLACPATLLAPPVPAWWAERGATDSTRTADDYAAANLGQLKHFASKAAEEFNETLPGGAGAAVNGLIAGWNQPPPGGITRDDLAPLTLGQLKSVAKPFYDRRAEVGYPRHYPWTGSGKDADDQALANLGQIKYVFSFDFSVSSSGDGLPDGWKFRHFGTLIVDPAADADGDGLSNAAEFAHGTDPNNRDTDGDGVPDGWATVAGMNPINSEGFNEAPGEDGATYLELYQQGAAPETIGEEHDDRRKVFTSEQWRGASFNRTTRMVYPQIQTQFHSYYHRTYGLSTPHDDGFNGDADLQGNMIDPGDPRDDSGGNPVAILTEITEEEYLEHQGEDDYIRSTGTTDDPLGIPVETLIGVFKNWNNDPKYLPPSIDGSPSFDQAFLTSLLTGTSYGGWQGDGSLGIMGKSGSASWTQWTDPPTEEEEEEGGTGTFHESARSLSD